MYAGNLEERCSCGLSKKECDYYEPMIIKSFTSSCPSCGIISVKYMGTWNVDHWEDEELLEEHNKDCKKLLELIN